MPTPTQTTGDGSNQPFRFFDIPAELRNRIYEYNFSGAMVKLKDKGKLLQAPSLLVACKQLYSEATSIYYAETMFYADSRDDIVGWLALIGPVRCKQIGSIGQSASHMSVFSQEGAMRTGRLHRQADHLEAQHQYLVKSMRSMRSIGLDIDEKKLMVQFVVPRNPGTAVIWTGDPKRTGKEMIARLGKMM